MILVRRNDNAIRICFKCELLLLLFLARLIFNICRYERAIRVVVVQKIAFVIAGKSFLYELQVKLSTILAHSLKLAIAEQVLWLDYGHSLRYVNRLVNATRLPN